MSLETIPRIFVDFSFGYGPGADPPVYTTIPDTAPRELHTKRGKSSEMGRIEAGTADCVLSNNDRRFDPTFAASPYYPNVKPEVRMRIRIGENEVTNGNFESGTTGWTSTNTTNFTGDPGWAKFGTRSLYVKGTVLNNDISAFWNSAPANPGDTKTASAWVNVLQACTNNVKIRIDFYSGAGATGTLLSSTDSAAAVGLGVQQVKVTAVAPATTQSYRLRIFQVSVGTQTGEWYIDGVSVVNGTASQPFVSQTYSISVTAIEDWKPLEIGEGMMDLVAEPQGVDALASISAANFSATRSAERSDIRIGAVLDAISFSSTRRSLATGQSTIQGKIFDNEGAKNHIDEVQDSENGLVFIDGADYIVFHDRQRRFKPPYTTPIAIFGDSAPDLPYADESHDYSSRYVFNDIHGQRANDAAAPEYIAQDAVSIAAYRKRSMTWSPWLISDAEVQDGTNFRLSLYSAAVFRFTKVVIEPQLDERLWDIALPREIGDRITMRKHPKGGVLIEQDCHIESIEHHLVVGRYQIVWELSPASMTAYWIMGDPINSIMGTTTRLGY